MHEVTTRIEIQHFDNVFHGKRRWATDMLIMGNDMLFVDEQIKELRKQHPIPRCDIRAVRITEEVIA